MGYPELVDLPKYWSAVSQHLGICNGLGTGDATQLRGDAGALNAAIGNDVSVVNSQHPNGVSFTFVDVVTGQTSDHISKSDRYLFEPANGTRHELCSAGNEPWLNGVSRNITRSFHPNSDGEDAMGYLLAQVLTHLYAPKTPHPSSTTTTTKPATGYAVGDSFSDYCVVAWPTAPVITKDDITMTMTCQHVPENEFLFTQVIYADPSLGITPDTGTVLVQGKIAGVATSNLGFKELVVVASKIVL
jgi:hypothetical protein